MIHIAICDSDSNTDFLHYHITAILDWLQEEDYRIWTYTSANTLLQSPNKYHIVFLDLNLDYDVDGIEIAHKFRKKGYASCSQAEGLEGQGSMGAINAWQTQKDAGCVRGLSL